jgi:hypothetical protein
MRGSQLFHSGDLVNCQSAAYGGTVNVFAYVRGTTALLKQGNPEVPSTPGGSLHVFEAHCGSVQNLRSALLQFIICYLLVNKTKKSMG